MALDPGPKRPKKKRTYKKPSGVSYGRGNPKAPKTRFLPHPSKTEGIGPAYTEDAFPKTVKPKARKNKDPEKLWPNWVAELRAAPQTQLAKAKPKRKRRGGKGWQII